MTAAEVPRRCQIWVLSPLVCSHDDDTPDLWHDSDQHGGPVCAACCPVCNPRESS